jgi:hypothetical protein
MAKKFIITEEDRTHILSLYGIMLNETLDPVKGGEQSFTVNFKAGFYDVANDKAYLDGEKKFTEEIDNFVKTELLPYLQKNPSTIVGMTFRSGESLIPNTDNEGKDAGKNKPLIPGRLSQLRKYYLENYLNSVIIPQIQAIDKQAQIPQLVYEEKKPTEQWIGKPWCKTPTDKEGRSCLAAWKTAGYPDREKYNQDQLSEFSISVKPIEITTTEIDDGCLAELKIRIYVQSHQCQNAEFFVFANDTLLTNRQGGLTANMNNDDTKRGIPNAKEGTLFSPMLLNPGYGYLKNGDDTVSYGEKNEVGDIGGQRSDTFIITNEQSKEIIKAGIDKYGKKLNIFMYATTTPSHSDICYATITKKDGTVVFDSELLGVKGKVVVLDECGNKKLDEPGDQNAIPSVGNNLTNLVAERTKLQNQLSSNPSWLKILKTSKVDKKALVQEHVFSMITKITSLLQFLNDSYCTKKETYENVKVRMENDLKIFNNLLNNTGGETEGEQLNVNFRKKIDGLSDDDIKYENKIFANSPMMKEIRYYVDNFYSAYAMLYYDKKKGGIGVLDEKTLKIRLDSLTKKVKLRKTLGLNNFSCSASKG